jgi:hypothetical protein
MASELEALPPSWQTLIQETLSRGVKLSPEKVMRIWQVGQERKIPVKTLWVEIGYQKHKNGKPDGGGVGYKHMLTHAYEFEKMGISQNKLPELAEAGTKVGIIKEKKKEEKEEKEEEEKLNNGKKERRPVIGLVFYGKPVAIEVTIGSNGFIVGMNPKSMKYFRKVANMGGETSFQLPEWPIQGSPTFETVNIE